jgi:hypothetical protein
MGKRAVALDKEKWAKNSLRFLAFNSSSFYLFSKFWLIFNPKALL